MNSLMKNMLLVLVFSSAAFFGPHASFAGVINWETLEEQVPSTYLAIRCAEWLDYSYSECAQTAEQLMQILDVKRSKKTLGLVFYHGKFISFFESKWITAYLTDLNHHLDLLKRHETSDFNLYEFTKTFCKTNLQVSDQELDSRAAELIAVLFQDNTKPYPVNWLDHNEQGFNNKDLSKLYQKVLSSISSNEGNKEFFKFIHFYPAAIEAREANFGRSIYYYYMPWYLTHELTKALPQTPRFRKLAQIMPLLMSLIYKYQHAYLSYTKALLKSPVATGSFDEDMNYAPLLKDFKTGELDQAWLGRYRDWYMAYLGTVQIEETIKNRTVYYCRYKDFIKMMAERPVAALKEIDRTYP